MFSPLALLAHAYHSTWRLQ